MRCALALLLAVPKVVAFRIPEQASRSNESDEDDGRQLGEAVCNAYIYDTGLFDKGTPHGMSCDHSCDGGCDAGCDICDTRPGALIRICNRGCDADCDICDTGCDVCPYMPPAPPPPPPREECKTECIVANVFIGIVCIVVLIVIIYLLYLCCCKPKTTETTTETVNADGSVTKTTTKTTESQDNAGFYDPAYGYGYGPTNPVYSTGPVLTFDGSDGVEFLKSADQANNVSQMPLLGMAQAPQKGT